MQKIITLCLCVLLVGVSGCDRATSDKVVERTVVRGGDQQDVAMVKQGNAKMEAAMEEARRTVGEITGAMQSAKPGQEFTVKIPVTDGTTTEFMWLNDLTFDGTAFRGTLADDPYQVKGYKMGQKMTVPQAKIADWIITDADGTQRGGYTEKVIEESQASGGKP